MSAGPSSTRHIRLRLVEEQDAETILTLRMSGDRGKYLSPVDHDVDAQRLWIRSYKAREAAGQEYYYIIEGLAGQSLGAVRLYDFKDDSFSWGSWVLGDDAPTYAAIESALSVYELGFYRLGFARSHFEVRKGNDRVVAFHRRFGATDTAEDDLNIYFSYSREAYEKTKRRYAKFFQTD